MLGHNSLGRVYQSSSTWIFRLKPSKLPYNRHLLGAAIWQTALVDPTWRLPYIIEIGEFSKMPISIHIRSPFPVLLQFSIDFRSAPFALKNGINKMFLYILLCTYLRFSYSTSKLIRTIRGKCLLERKKPITLIWSDVSNLLGTNSASHSIRFQLKRTKYLTPLSVCWWCTLYRWPSSSSPTVRSCARLAAGVKKVSLVKIRSRGRDIIVERNDIYGTAVAPNNFNTIMFVVVVFFWSNSRSRRGHPSNDRRHAGKSTHQNCQNDPCNYFRFHLLLDTLLHHEHLVTTAYIPLLYTVCYSSTIRWPIDWMAFENQVGSIMMQLCCHSRPFFYVLKVPVGYRQGLSVFH